MMKIIIIIHLHYTILLLFNYKGVVEIMYVAINITTRNPQLNGYFKLLTFNDE